MRATLDTNVLVSGTFWNGDSFKILELIDSGKVELVLSEELVEEYIKTINSDEIIEKIIDKDLIINKVIQKVITKSSIVKPEQKFNMIKEDSEDNKVIECAFEGKVNYIITQDKHLLDIKQFREIKIVSPEEFLNILSQKE